MGSTPHALRRDTALRVVGSADARPHMASTDAEIRQLTRETLRVVGWEFELANRSLAWHAPIGSILAIPPRDAVSVTPSNGSEPSAADIADWLVAPIVTTLQAGAPWRDYELQQRLESMSGEVQHFLVRARQVRENGEVVGCAGLVVDISDRQLVEANMRELIDRYRRLVDLSPDGIVVHQGGRVVYVNRAGVGLIGAPATSTTCSVARSSTSSTPTRSARPSSASGSSPKTSPVSEAAEAALVRFDGTPLVVESVSVLTRWEGEDAYQVILRDLTDRKLAEAALRYQASLVEHVSDAIIGVDVFGRVESWNHAAELIYGVTSEAAVGSWFHDLVGLPEGFGKSALRDVESIHTRHDGMPLIVRASVTAIFDDVGDQTGWVVVCADTTERRRAEEERRAVEALHSTVIEAVDEGIIVADAAGVVVDANPAAHRILPLVIEPGARLVDCIVGPDGLVGADRRPLATADHPVARALANNETMHDVLIGLVIEDTERWLALSCRPLPAASGAPAGTVCSFADVTNVILAQQELSYRATHDELTGLCNRTVFVDSLQHALARGRRTQANTAVLFVDIDRFKVVNDTLGHASGDEVLTEIGKRLERATRSMDRVGRIAGDEFIVMCSDVTGIEPVAQRAVELEQLISQPIFLSNGRQPALHASIGIAFATGGDGDAEELLRDAHVAMRRAKEQGGTQVEIFDDALRVQAERRRQLELALRVALDNHQIDVYFQPIVAVSSPRVLGVEALARFNHPTLGFIPPDEFIHVAEETDLILTLGIEVLGKACTQAAQWRATDPDARDLYVSVNLSARQLYDPHLVQPGRDRAAHDRARPRRALARDHRERVDGRRADRGAHLRRAARPRRAPRRRRLRHGLLVARVPPGVPGGDAQDRPLVRHGSRRGRQQRSHRARHHQPRDVVEAAGGRRRCRAQRAARNPRPARMRLLPGLALQRGPPRGRARLLPGDAEGVRELTEATLPAALIRLLPDVISIVDASGLLTYTSPGSYTMLGYLPEELVGTSAFDLIHPVDQVSALEGFTSTMRRPTRGPSRCSCGSGTPTTWIDAEIIGTNHLDDPEIAGMVVTIRDVSASMRTDGALRLSEERYRLIVELGREGICVIDDGENTTFANHALADLLDTTVNEMLGSSLLDFIDVDDRAEARIRIAGPNDDARTEQDLRIVTRQGRLVWARIRASAIRHHDGTYRGAIVFVTDVTERRNLEQRLAEEARRDPLTGVANRKELFETLAPILQNGSLTAALYVDLDGFKDVNDRFGHTLGDELLCSVAGRVRGAIRVIDTLARRRRRVRGHLPRPREHRRSGRDRRTYP